MALVFQRPATTHELLIGDATGELAESAVWLRTGETAEMAKKPEIKEPFPEAAAPGGGGIDSSCSSLPVSPPPPMRALLSSGGQSSAYAALKAMNPCDLQAGAHLVRTDKKGVEPLLTSSSSSKHFSLFSIAGAAPTSTEMCRPLAPPQGPSSLTIQPAAQRQSAAATAAAAMGPASLDSKVITAAEVRLLHGDCKILDNAPNQNSFQALHAPSPPPYPPMMSTTEIHTPPGHMLVPPDLTLPKAGKLPHQPPPQQHQPPLIFAGHAFLAQVHPGSITTSVVTPSGSRCGHFTHMNFSQHQEPPASMRHKSR